MGTLKLYNEKKYKGIIEEIGQGCYGMYTPTDKFINFLYGTIPGEYENRFMGSCISTSATTAISTVDYLIEGYKICKTEPVIIQRAFRYCEHDGKPHINADDSAIFVDIKGNIWKVTRDPDASKDHYVSIAEWAGLRTIADAHHLPEEPRGPYNRYTEKGASIPIVIEIKNKQ